MIPQRLLRLQLLLGAEKTELIGKSRVMIVGIGGVGGTAFECLLRSGVGHFIIIDSDRFDETNLNRQILCTREFIGKAKTEAAAARALSIDPEVVTECFNTFLDEGNTDSFLDMNPTVVVDAIDSVKSKVHLLKRCVERGIPVVSSMGAGLRKDPTKLKTDDISRTFSDPLAKEVRKLLRDCGIEEGIRCVFSTEKPSRPVNALIASTCAVTSSFGNALAQAALDEITETGC